MTDIIDVNKETKLPAIPSLSEIDAENPKMVSQTLEALKETLEVRLGQRGDRLDQSPTWRDLYKNGTIDVLLKGTLLSNPNPTTLFPRPTSPVNTEQNLTIPPTPQALTAVGGFENILLAWTMPTYGNHSYTEIYRYDSDDIGQAEMIGIASGYTHGYSDSVGVDQSYYYWVRFVSTSGVFGPYNATAGVLGATSKKVSDLINDLNDAIGQTHLTNTLSSSINKIAANETNIATLDTFVQSRSQNNLLDMTVWKPQSVNGNLTGDNGGVWNLNGTAAENSLVLYDDGPSGHSTVVWKALSANGSNDGGWTTGNIDIDHLKTYRSVVWIKKMATNDGTTYLGCRGYNTKNLSGSVNNNPYFWSGDLPQLNKWYLIVGIIHGSSYAGGYSGVAGVYDPVTGEKVLTGTEFKMVSGATTQTHRSYLFYTNVDNVVQYFANPRFEEVNGNEPSLGALLANKDFVSTVQTTKQAVDGISAEQFVKVDVNGNVAGYGIYGTSTFNEFAVNADVFKIADGTSSIQPFIVVSGAGLTIATNGTQYGNTTQAWQQANHPTGVWFPAGTYIDTSFIADATIDTAKIKNLTVDFANVTGNLSAAQVSAINLSANQITGGTISGLTINGGRINSGSAYMQNGEINGAYIKGGVVEGAFILSSQTAAVTEAGTPHYAYRIGVSDLKTSTGTTYAKSILALKPYNYYITTIPSVTGNISGNNYYRYRRQNICGSHSTPPSISAKFYWSGSPEEYKWNGFTRNFFTVQIRKYIGSSNIVDTETFTATGRGQWPNGVYNITDTHTKNVNGFVFTTTVSHERYAVVPLFGGIKYYLYANAQWINFTITAPSTFNYNTNTADGWGFDITVTCHRGSSSNLELSISDTADNDY